MNKIFKWALGSVAVLLLFIQLIPKNLPENKPETENDLLAQHVVPENIAGILKTSCYDCHSNATVYPWYSYVTPVNYLISHDVNEGRDELNFSEWGTYDKKKKIKKLNEIVEEVEEGKMPMPIYTTLHGHAKISAEQQALLSEWVDQMTEEILNSPLEANQ